MSDLTAVQQLALLEKEDALEAAKREAEEAEGRAIQELKNRDIIKAYKAKMPGVALTRVDTPAGMFLIQSPTADQYKRAMQGIAEGNTDGANAILARGSLVYPETFEAFEEQAKGFPATEGQVAYQASQLVGLGLSSAKKV